jgi:hypothetical protein
MVNYQNGKIYKIEDVGGNMCYIGSTTKDFLSKRMVQHRASYTSFKNRTRRNVTVFTIFETYGLENCRIVLVELCPCDSKDELLKREAYFIRTLKCVNKVVPDRTKAEYAQKRHEEHKEEKDEYNKQYLKKNKETIYAKKATVAECECGKTFTYGHKSRHLKTKKHLDYIANIPLNV